MLSMPPRPKAACRHCWCCCELLLMHAAVVCVAGVCSWSYLTNHVVEPLDVFKLPVVGAAQYAHHPNGVFINKLTRQLRGDDVTTLLKGHILTT